MWSKCNFLIWAVLRMFLGRIFVKYVKNVLKHFLNGPYMKNKNRKNAEIERNSLKVAFLTFRMTKRTVFLYIYLTFWTFIHKQLSFNIYSVFFKVNPRTGGGLSQLAPTGGYKPPPPQRSPKLCVLARINKYKALVKLYNIYIVILRSGHY